MSEAVPAGAKLIGAGDNLTKAASWIKPEAGFFDVVVHGIRLISCSSGGSPTGVAKDLANKLGVKVKALSGSTPMEI